jgi:hypothetical protein
MFGLFASKQDKTLGTKILVASLSDAFAAEMEADSQVYRRHYRSVQAQFFPNYIGLREAIRGVDVLHLLASLDLNGQLATSSGEHLAAAALLDECVGSDVKAVIIASENAPGAYVRGVPARPLNLVMTLGRKGEAFPAFLEGLCTLLASGVKFPSAWVKNAPQAPGPWHDSLPECIFHAGKPNAVLLP